jgi:hypothetical protein
VIDKGFCEALGITLAIRGVLCPQRDILQENLGIGSGVRDMTEGKGMVLCLRSIDHGRIAVDVRKAVDLVLEGTQEPDVHA